MNLNLSALGAAEQAQLAALLAKAGLASEAEMHQSCTPHVITSDGKTADTSATPKTRRPRKRRTQVKYFTEAEIESLFRVIESPRDRAIFRICYHRGLRASEIGMIQFSDLDMKDERITIRRLKGSKGGLFHLTSNEIRALRPWLKIRGNDPGPLFPSRQKTPISQPRLDRMIRHYGRLAGLPAEKCHMHALKHSCCQHLLQRGESIDQVADHVGHRSVSSTQIYTDFGGVMRESRDKRLRNW